MSVPELAGRPRPLSVNEVNRLLNTTLERECPRIYFEGEVSGVSRPGSGHLYFSIKDPDQRQSAKVDVVIWRTLAQTLTFAIEEGISVQCEGRPNVYAVTGKLQIVISKIRPSGAGLLQKRFMELKARLEKEGLFAEERKRALPFFPRAIGVVTSRSGAVIHDIMVKIRERMPQLVVYLVDVRVQGEGAAQEIANGVRRLSESNLVEVIIVARGGGSLEDLWAFNEEVVVRAVFASRVPVISGVGHEVDVSLSDLVADVRAPTPTAAAEMVVPHRVELLRRITDLERRLLDFERWYRPLEQRLDDLERSLRDRMQQRHERANLRIVALQSRLAAIRPETLIERYSRRVDQLRERALHAGTRDLHRRVQELDLLAHRLHRAFHPDLLRRTRDRVADFEGRIERAAAHSFSRATHAVEHLALRLEGVNPERVIERGFAIVSDLSGRVIQSAIDLPRGSEAVVRLRDGRVGVRVEKRIDTE